MWLVKSKWRFCSNYLDLEDVIVSICLEQYPFHCNSLSTFFLHKFNRSDTLLLHLATAEELPLLAAKRRRIA